MQMEKSTDLKSIRKIMNVFSLEDVNVAIFLDVRTQKKNGTYPVKIRVTYDKGKQRYFPAKDILLEDWNDLLSNPNTKKADLVEIKKDIYITFNNIVDIVKELAPGRHFTIRALERRLSGGKKDSVQGWFRSVIAQLEEEDRVGNASWYSCALSSIDRYVKEEDLMFADVTEQWLRGYQKHLQKEKKSDTTVSMYMRALRSIINKGKAEGIITDSMYPFGEKKYQIPPAEGDKLALTDKQILKVMTHPIPDMEKWRDLWIFSFYCQGINMNDILRLKQENIKRGNIIEWSRKKTSTRGVKSHKIKAFIVPEMQEIIDKYSGRDYLFPYLTDDMTEKRKRDVIQLVTHNVNRCMKKIGNALGYGRITSYTARHSYAYIARNANIKLFDISKSLGHTSLKTTEIYLGGLSNDDLARNASVMPRLKKIVNNKKKIV